MTEPICVKCKHIYVRAQDCGVFDDIIHITCNHPAHVYRDYITGGKPSRWYCTNFNSNGECKRFEECTDGEHPLEISRSSKGGGCFMTALVSLVALMLTGIVCALTLYWKG